MSLFVKGVVCEYFTFQFNLQRLARFIALERKRLVFSIDNGADPACRIMQKARLVSLSAYMTGS